MDMGMARTPLVAWPCHTDMEMVRREAHLARLRGLACCQAIAPIGQEGCRVRIELHQLCLGAIGKLGTAVEATGIPAAGLCDAGTTEITHVHACACN